MSAAPASHPAAEAGRLRLEGVSRTFGAVRAVDGVSLAIEPGELVAFLGPSGCGKTTLLRMIAGLERPEAGRILLGGRDVTALPAWKRNIGLVFQSLALFPHLTVGGNVGYGLALRRAPRAEVDRRVEDLLALVRLPGMGGRPVAALSGGQRQRVAIARALALEPGLFLLDEPLSALDAQLREAMQVELRLLQRQLGVTTILVTHDQREAMTMADRVVVFAEGRVQQDGPPLEVYRNPASSFVATFLGTSTLLEATLGDGIPRVGGTAFPGVPVPPEVAGRASAVLSLRPEDLVARPGPDEPWATLLDGRLAFRRDLGASSELHVDWDGRTLVALAPAGLAAQPGEALRLGLRPGAGRIMAR